jgi:hypothetical protein
MGGQGAEVADMIEVMVAQDEGVYAGCVEIPFVESSYNVLSRHDIEEFGYSVP